MKIRVHPEVMKKMRAMAIKQAMTEIKDIDDRPTVEYIAKRHGLGYGELKQAYMKGQQDGADKRAEA
jgi:hypothetical protein